MRPHHPGYPDSLRVQRDPQTGRSQNIGGTRPPEPSQVLKWMLRLGLKEVPAVAARGVPPEQFCTLAVGETVVLP